MRIGCKTTLALAALAALLGTARDASAGLVLTITTSTGASQQITTTTDPSTFSYSGTVGDFSVNVTAMTNSPGENGDDGGNLTNIVNSAMNNGASSESITFSLTSDGFTLPGASGSALFFNSILSTNPLLERSGQVISMTSFITQGSLTQNTPTQYVIANRSPNSSTNNSSVSAPFVRNTSSYTLSNVISANVANGAKFNANGQVLVSSSSAGGTSVVLTSPEPASMTLILAGLPVLGLVYVRRRRTASTPAA